MDDLKAALEAIEARQRNCQTYNFGMRDADQLAHKDVPLLLALTRRLLQESEAQK